MTHEEISLELGMCKSWLSMRKNHREEITRLFGKVSIETVKAFMKETDRLENIFKIVVNEELLSHKELVIAIYNEERRPSAIWNLYDSIVTPKKYNPLIDWRLYKVLKLVEEKANERMNKLKDIL